MWIISVAMLLWLVQAPIYLLNPIYNKFKFFYRRRGLLILISLDKLRITSPFHVSFSPNPWQIPPTQPEILHTHRESMQRCEQYCRNAHTPIQKNHNKQRNNTPLTAIWILIIQNNTSHKTIQWVISHKQTYTHVHAHEAQQSNPNNRYSQWLVQ